MAVGFVGRTTAAVVVAVAVLSGCSDEQPANETLPTTSAEPSPSAEELPPLGPADFPVPDEAREKTPEGALEFTRYYVALGAHIGTGPLDPRPLLDLSRGCSQCQRVADAYANDLQAGYRYGAAGYSFEELGPGVLSSDSAQVAFIYSQEAFEVVDSSGAVVPERSSPSTGPLQSGAVLTWDQALRTWLVTELTIG